MKSLGKTIDRILKIVPALEPKLTVIKSKWERYPKRTMAYWKELANTLSEDLTDDTERERIKEVLLTPSQPKPIYTFEEVGVTDHILGTIPQNLADKICRHDLASIRMSMMQTKVARTRDRDLTVKLSRQAAKTEIAMKKIWVDLKDHFDLWDKDMKVAIKKNGPLLVLIDDSHVQAPTPNGDGFMMKVDHETLKGFFRMLGMEPPPGFF